MFTTPKHVWNGTITITVIIVYYYYCCYYCCCFFCCYYYCYCYYYCCCCSIFFRFFHNRFHQDQYPLLWRNFLDDQGLPIDVRKGWWLLSNRSVHCYCTFFLQIINCFFPIYSVAKQHRCSHFRLLGNAVDQRQSVLGNAN